MECLKNGAMSCYKARDKGLALDLLNEFEELFPDEIIEEETPDVEMQEESPYDEFFLNEVGMYLEVKHKIEPDNIVLMLNKLKRQINNDPEYVYHYNSEYWADYIAEASSLGKESPDVEIDPDNFLLKNETIIEGKYAEDIRQEMMRKPTESALERNRKASELLHKLRR